MVLRRAPTPASSSQSHDRVIVSAGNAAARVVAYRRVPERSHARHLHRMPISEGTMTSRAPERAFARWLMRHCNSWATVLEEGDQHAPPDPAFDVIRGPVDRIKKPASAATDGSTELLPDYCIVGTRPL